MTAPTSPSSPFLADYHVHTPYCGHAQGKIIEYVDKAVEKGISELGFSDHLGRYYLTKSQKRRYWDWGMEGRNVPRYISEVHDLSEIYAEKIALKVGLEVDYVMGAEDLLKPILDLYPLDFMLASIHCLPRFGWKHLAHYTRRDPWPLFEEYFRMAKMAIDSGLFDCLAHLDFIWRYVKWPRNKSAEVFESISRTVSCAARKNVAIEINANAFLWSQLYKIDEGDPFEILLEAIAEHDAPITLGSDAHKPDFVGKAFKDLIVILRRKGIKHFSTFSQHQRQSHPLP